MWSHSEVAGEVGRNLAASKLRTLSLILMLCLTSALGMAADAEAIRSIRDDYREFVEAGGHVVWIGSAESTEEPHVDARRCAELAASPGIVRTGGQRHDGSVSLVRSPSNRVIKASYTGSLLGIWENADGWRSAAINVAVGPVLAAELGLSVGSKVSEAGSSRAAEVDLVLTEDGRSRRSARWLLYRIPPLGTLDECWVELHSGTFWDAADDLAPWLQGSGGMRLATYEVVSEASTGRSFSERLAGRPEQWWWIAVTAVNVALIWMMLWTRRAELALYRALGVTRPQQLASIAAESLALVFLSSVAALVLASYWLVATSGAAADSFAVLLRATAASAAAQFALAPAAAAFLWRRSIADLLKDR